MSKTSGAINTLPAAALKSLRDLGADLALVNSYSNSLTLEFSSYIFLLAFSKLDKL